MVPSWVAMVHEERKPNFLSQHYNQGCDCENSKGDLKAKNGIIREQRMKWEWVRRTQWAGGKEILRSSRIYTIDNMGGRPWNIPSGCGLLPAGCPCLVEVFKMLSMKKTEKSWGRGERGNRLFLIRFHLLKQCLVPPRDQQFDTIFLLSGLVLPSLPSLV